MFSGCEQYWCTARNVASGGMALISPVGGTPGSFLRIQFTLPDSQDLLPVDAILVREECTGAGFLWGICFLEPDSWVIACIESYVRDQLVTRVRSHCANTAKRSAATRARLQAAAILKKKARRPAAKSKEKVNSAKNAYSVKQPKDLKSLLDKAVDSTK